MPALSIAENLTLGDPPVRRLFGAALVDRARMREEARAQLASFDFAPDPDLPVRQLGFAEQQIVAIAKALRRHCRVLVLDEPTAALENREIDRLFAVLARLKDQGTAIVYVSHRLEEVVELADRCTVLRDGRVAAWCVAARSIPPIWSQAMTGRAAEQQADYAGDTRRCAARRRRRPPRCHSLRAGEVIGLAGLLGSGTTAVLQRFFGLGADGRRPRAVSDRLRRLDSPIAAIASGIGLVPPRAGSVWS